MERAAGLNGTRIVVIGAGAIGSVLTYRLALSGAQVTVVERGRPGGGASYGSFAWINACGKEPREYYDLNFRGIGEHETLQTELGGDWVHRDGLLVWLYRSDRGRPETGGSDAFRKAIALWRSWGYEMESLSPEHVVRELEPELRIDPQDVDEVFRVPMEGWVEVAPMIAAVLRAATRYGAQLVEDEVTGLRRTGGRVDGVMLADGKTLAADIVVNAAGPDGARIASLAGVPFPLKRAPGAMIVTQPLPTSLRHIVHPGGYHYWHPAHPHLRPDGGGRVMIHATQVDALVASGERIGIDHPAVANAIHDSANVLPALRWARATEIRIGSRAISPDELPIVGFDPLVPGLYHAIMHSGITLAPISGRLITDELAGARAPEFAKFRIDRFPDREWVTLEQVVYAYEKEAAAAR